MHWKSWLSQWHTNSLLFIVARICWYFLSESWFVARWQHSRYETDCTTVMMRPCRNMKRYRVIVPNTLQYIFNPNFILALGSVARGPCPGPLATPMRSFRRRCKRVNDYVSNRTLEWRTIFRGGSWAIFDDVTVFVPRERLCSVSELWRHRQVWSHWLLTDSSFDELRCNSVALAELTFRLHFSQTYIFAHRH